MTYRQLVFSLALTNVLTVAGIAVGVGLALLSDRQHPVIGYPLYLLAVGVIFAAGGWGCVRKFKLAQRIWRGE